MDEPSTKYPIKHAISFHGSISRAKSFDKSQDLLTKAIPSFEGIESFHVSGSMPTSKRTEIIEEFADSQRSLITNARCLTEGVNVPNIDCVIFVDPRKSTIDIVQAVGRALRKFEGKKYGYVIIPILTQISSEEIISENTFKDLLSVLRALASNDERIVEYFRAIQSKKRSDSGLIEWDVDIINPAELDLQQFTTELELKLWSSLGKLSWRPFKEARDYVHGLNLSSFKKYQKLHNRPPDIPANPNIIYKKDWKGFSDWIGTGTVATQLREYLSFKEGKKVVHGFEIKKVSEWRRFTKSKYFPKDIPTDPGNVYIKDWKGYGDWLGTGTVATNLRE